CPEARCDVPENAAVIEEGYAFFDKREIKIKVPCLCACVWLRSYTGATFTQKQCHVRMNSPKVLELDIRRISYNGIKATAREHCRESQVPIKGVYSLLLHFVVEVKIDLPLVKIASDQTIAFPDVLVER